MIPFFRKIRHKLANENKFIQYSRYAIGEILLVVLGILIALQINQWNENRKENIALQVLTENLNNEFRNNYQELEIDLARLQRKISSCTTLLLHTGLKKSDIPKLKIDSLIFDAVDNPTWNPSSFVLNDIKNSGKLSSIKSKNLKQLLYDWERLYEDILEWHNAMDKTGNSLNDVINNKGSFINIDYFRDINNTSKFNISNLILLQEIKFENTLENNLYTAQGLEKRYTRAKVLLKEIIAVSKNNRN